MSILVIGNGLNSCVASSLFASVGNNVFWLSGSSALRKFQQEPGLALLYKEQIESGRLQRGTVDEYKNSAANSASFVLIDELEASQLINNYLSLFRNLSCKNAIIILLTPMDIGETKKLRAELRNANLEIEVCSVPVLVREGRALTDFSRPESITLGSDSQEVAERVKSLFYPFNRVKNGVKVVTSSEAEFSCFARHAMLATRLSFMNEMASLAEKFQVDIDVVRECIGADPRIGKDYLYPGCGFGGKTLALNLEKISNKLRQRNDDLGLLDVVSKINERQKDLLFRKLWKFFEGNLSEVTVAIWGASFKPKTDSIEGSPAITLIESLLEHDAIVQIYDPLANENVGKIFDKNEKIKYCRTANDALVGASVLTICTEWQEFWSPDFELMSKELKEKAVFDGRNLYNPSSLSSYGLSYFGIGR